LGRLRPGRRCRTGRSHARTRAQAAAYQLARVQPPLCTLAAGRDQRRRRATLPICRVCLAPRLRQVVAAGDRPGGRGAPSRGTDASTARPKSSLHGGASVPLSRAWDFGSGARAGALRATGKCRHTPAQGSRDGSSAPTTTCPVTASASSARLRHHLPVRSTVPVGAGAATAGNDANRNERRQLLLHARKGASSAVPGELLFEQRGTTLARAVAAPGQMLQKPFQCSGDVAETNRKQGRAQRVPDQREHSPRLLDDALVEATCPRAAAARRWQLGRFRRTGEKLPRRWQPGGRSGRAATSRRARRRWCLVGSWAACPGGRSTCPV